MNSIVCIKQVPGSTQVEMDPETGVLKRDSVAAKLNPFDLFALESAFSIKERCGGRITALSMGPPQAKEALLEALWMGADTGVLLSDRKLGGADVAATSYTLAQGVRAIGEFDLIICGKQTTDGDTAQVGPELAERLGLEHASNVIRIDEIDAQSITVTMDLDDVLQTQRMCLPCLIIIDKDANTPRLPSCQRKFSIDAEKQLRVFNAANLKADEARLGLKGSATQVERIFPPEKSGGKQMLSGDAEQLSNEIYNWLLDKKYL